MIELVQEKDDDVKVSWRIVRRQNRLLITKSIMLLLCCIVLFHWVYYSVQRYTEHLYDYFRPTVVLSKSNLPLSIQLHIKKKLVEYLAAQKRFFVSGYECCSYLKTEYSFIKDIGCTLSLIPLSYTFTIQAYKPICLVNKNYVALYEDSKLYPKDYFDHEELASVSIDEQWSVNRLDIQAHKFLSSLPSNILKDFSLTYHNYFFIVVQPKDVLLKNVSIYATAEQRDWATINEWIRKAQSDVERIVPTWKRKKERKIIIDMRFSGHIIIKHF